MCVGFVFYAFAFILSFQNSIKSFCNNLVLSSLDFCDEGEHDEEEVVVMMMVLVTT